MRYSNEELLSEIRRLAEELGHSPTLAEFREYGKYAVTTYYSRFGSWNEAIEAAGYKPNEPDSKVPKDELLDELQRLADEIGEKPSAAQMNEQGKYWRSTYKNQFGSWNEALEVAGFEAEKQEVDITDSDLVQEIHRLANKLGKQPTFRDMQTKGNYSPHVYARQFGSWNNGLVAAGFESETRGSMISEDALLNEIARLADELGEPPSAREMDSTGRYASATYQRRFGSWSQAVETALE